MAVHLLFALDTVQTILSLDDTFFYFVYGFGNVPRLFELHFAFDIPTLDALIGLLVQGVYCWRIWVLSGWKVIPMFSLVVGYSFFIITTWTLSPLCERELEPTCLLWVYQVSLMAGASGFAAGIQVRHNIALSRSAHH